MKYVARLLGVPVVGKPVQTFHPSQEAAKKWANMVLGGDVVAEGAYVEIYKVVEEPIEQVRR